MSAIRRQLSVLSAVWLSCQLALVCAAAAFDMTRPSTALADNAKLCLEGTPADQCPMHDATGQPCPMHRGTASTTSHEAHGDKTCALRSTTVNPGVLAGLFTLPAVTFDAEHAAPMLVSALPLEQAAGVPTAPTSHDTPPPRS